MTKQFLRNLLESAFDLAAAEDALVEIIADYIDYDELARSILNQHQDEIMEELEYMVENLL